MAGWVSVRRARAQVERRVGVERRVIDILVPIYRNVYIIIGVYVCVCIRVYVHWKILYVTLECSTAQDDLETFESVKNTNKETRPTPKIVYEDEVNVQKNSLGPGCHGEQAGR